MTDNINLVITIPKEIYNYIHNEHMAMRVCDSHEVAKAIANGTPLPEGQTILDFIEDNYPTEIGTDWERGCAYALDRVEELFNIGK